MAWVYCVTFMWHKQDRFTTEDTEGHEGNTGNKAFVIAVFHVISSPYTNSILAMSAGD